MRTPEQLVDTVLQRWEQEQITLIDFVSTMRHYGWTRRQVYAYIERELGVTSRPVMITHSEWRVRCQQCYASVSANSMRRQNFSCSHCGSKLFELIR